MAPPFEFPAEVFVPLLRRMGADVNLILERHGFAPSGGGRIRLEVTPEFKRTVVRGAIVALRATADEPSSAASAASAASA